MRDKALVLDIVLAARDALSFIRDLDWTAFQNSRLHQNAVVRSLEIIGEAAGKLSNDFRERHPTIDWYNAINMRHRLIHAYGDVRLDIVWDVTSSKLLPMIEVLEPLITLPD